MKRFLSHYRTLILVLLLMFVTLHLMSVHIERTRVGREEFSALDRGVLAVYVPVYRVVSWPFRKAVDLYNGYIGLVGIRKENQRLNQENQRLLAELTRMEELEKENRLLREEMAYREQDRPVLTAARVIARSPVEGSDAVLIDKGVDDGVERGMTVVTPGGLVGHVTAAAGRVSRVRLITDPLSAVDAVVARTRSRGIVKGDGNGTCRLMYVKWTDDVREGDPVISSGRGLFPPGLLVGGIARLDRKKFEMDKEVEIKPALEMDRLERVLILERSEVDRQRDDLEPEDWREEAG